MSLYATLNNEHERTRRMQSEVDHYRRALVLASEAIARQQCERTALLAQISSLVHSSTPAAFAAALLELAQVVGAPDTLVAGAATLVAFGETAHIQAAAASVSASSAVAL